MTSADDTHLFLNQSSSIHKSTILSGSVNAVSSKSKLLIAKRFDEEFGKLLESNGWVLDQRVSSDNAKKLIVHMGFVQSDSPVDTRLLIELSKALEQPTQLEGIEEVAIVLVENVRTCLKAIANLLGESQVIDATTMTTVGSTINVTNTLALPNATTPMKGGEEENH